MTTLLDQDRSAKTRLAVRASSVALGLAASVGLQVPGIARDLPAGSDVCRAPVHLKSTAL